MTINEEDKKFILSMHRDVYKSVRRARLRVLELLTLVSREYKDEAATEVDDVLYYLNRIERDLEDEEEGLGLVEDEEEGDEE